MRVLSIFIPICRELSIDKSLKASEESIFDAIQQLKEQEREVLVLTYIIGISREETAQLLQVSPERIKELLFSGFQLLRVRLGNGEHYQGCNEYQKLYLDYLERKLERPKKIDFEMHIYHCHNCQDDLASLQEVILSSSETIETFSVPAGFMENVKERISQREHFIKQKKKKRKRIGLISASVFALIMCTGFLPGFFQKSFTH